jgi:hypothetical protein
VDDEIYVTCCAANEGVERARPDLCVRGEFERRVASGEEERLEVGVLRRGDAEQTRLGVENGASCVAVAVVRVYVCECLSTSTNIGAISYVPVARRVREVPVSTMPAVVVRISVEVP